MKEQEINLIDILTKSKEECDKQSLILIGQSRAYLEMINFIKDQHLKSVQMVETDSSEPDTEKN